MPFLTKAQTDVGTVGFVESNIWYSKNLPEEGETIKIYTALWNSSTKTIKGRVAFFDKEIFLAEKTFSIEGNTIKTVSSDWKVTVGEHTIKAKITESQFADGTNASDSLLQENSSTPEIKTVIKKKIIPENNKNDTSSTSTTDDSLDTSDILGGTGEFFATGTPKKIAEGVASVIVKIDNLREKQEEKIQTKVNDTPKEDNYRKLFWNSLLYFFNNRLMFYIVIGLIVFAIAKLIRNKTRE